MDVTGVYERISAAYDVLNALQARLTEITAGEFPSDSPRLLLDLLTKLNSALEECLFWQHAEKARHLAEGSDNLKSKAELRRLEIRVSAIVKAAAELTPVIKFVDGARAQNNPWGLVGQIERLSRCIASNCSSIVRPRWEYDYTYYPLNAEMKRIGEKIELDKELRSALKSFIAQYPKFFALSFPPTQAQNVLQIATWAHELGHFVDNIEGEKRTRNPSQYLSEVIIESLQVKLTDEEKQQIIAAFTEDAGQSGTHITLSPNEIYDRLATMIVQMVRRWSREIFADIFSVYLFGPAALFGLCDIALVLFPDLDVITGSSHPSPRQRLKLMIEELASWSAIEDGKQHQYFYQWMDFLPPLEREAVQAELTAISNRLETSKDESWAVETKKAERVLRAVVERAVTQVASAVRSAVYDIVNRESATYCFLKPGDLKDIEERINRLHHDLPPLPKERYAQAEMYSQNFVQLAQCINAGWFYWLGQCQYGSQASYTIYKKLNEERTRTNRLLMKSIELSEARQWFIEHRSILSRSDGRQANRESTAQSQRNGNTRPSGGALSKREIMRRLDDGSLAALPLLDPAEQLGEAAIDIRLGNEFITTSQTRLQALDSTDQKIGSQLAEYQAKQYIPFGQSFALHPRQFVLGSTLEYIALPDDLTGLVVGRSSWGRLGLIIATAIKVDPGFQGVLTLELVNVGNIPILLYPCSRIAQLLLYHVSCDYSG